MYSLLSKRIATFIKHHSCNIVAHSAVQNVLKTGEILSITIKAAIITIVEVVFCGKSVHRGCGAEYSVTSVNQSINQSINVYFPILNMIQNIVETTVYTVRKRGILKKLCYEFVYPYHIVTI